jgi:hypothetical protein
MSMFMKSFVHHKVDRDGLITFLIIFFAVIALLLAIWI